MDRLSVRIKKRGVVFQHLEANPESEYKKCPDADADADADVHVSAARLTMQHMLRTTQRHPRSSPV